MKKRTKQVQLMVDEVNRGLKRRKVVEQNKDENFLFFSNKYSIVFIFTTPLFLKSKREFLIM